ncbi:MAG: response regulator [Candidatus Omnitrophica bacterium]|nr:response regulator [Candidatus Omnitrophota bacterium]
MTDKKTILVIDDALEVRKLLKFHFEKKGYIVILEENGQEGLNKIKNMAVDLVILDLMLPGLAGEEVCRQIRKDEKIKNIPIIMITAQESDVKQIIGMVIGADSYIIKPIDISEILKEVEKLIRKC